jgi:hypothetical protein
VQRIKGNLKMDRIKMWICYTIRKEDNFKQLSVITKDLQEIYDFITTITKIDSKSYIFEILKED